MRINRLSPLHVLSVQTTGDPHIDLRRTIPMLAAVPNPRHQLEEINTSWISNKKFLKLWFRNLGPILILNKSKIIEKFLLS